MNAEPGISEVRYNVKHKHYRNVIERAFGFLKGRFRCLLKHRSLHYTPQTAGRITYACMILHNICTRSGLNDEYVANEDDDEDYKEMNDGINDQHQPTQARIM